jgi:Glycosyltransferase family 28 C-terminal domain
MPRIAYFITPHGFGHAARASAIMDAVSDILPFVSFDILTTVPDWFFEDSLSGRFEYHEFLTDIGLVQKTPFLHHIEETIERLERFIPFAPALISDAADFITKRECRLVICDISPVGIAIAAEAGVPSILIENFTWDWIYEDFIPADARFRGYMDFFRDVYRGVDYHIQAAPVCNPDSVDMTTGPISRKIRLSSARVREKLGISQEKKTVLVTTGGVKEKYPFLKYLTTRQEICFIIPGASEFPEKHDNLILLPYRSGFMHSDLVNAADAVVGKAGYSTIAEVYQAGVPFGYVARPNFRETDKLVAFIEKEMKGMRIDDDEFKAGKWLPKISRLLNFPRIPRHDRNGSQQVAAMINDLLKQTQH